MASNKKGGILSKVPLPDTFFSIKHQLRPIASISVSAPSAILIYLLTIGGFVGCWWFYSLPNPPQTVTVIQSEWQKEGYECKPLQPDSHYKLMWTYDECQTHLRELSSSSLTSSLGSGNFQGYGMSGTMSGSNIRAMFYQPFSQSSKTYAVDTSKTIPTLPSITNHGLMTSDVDGSLACVRPGPLDEPPEYSSCYSLFEPVLKAFDTCEGFKQNSPFQCTKTEVTYKSSLEKLSLSIANTQLLFGVLTAFFAFMFYKCKNSPTIASDITKPWMEEIQQLREDLSRLRNDVDKSKKQSV